LSRFLQIAVGAFIPYAAFLSLCFIALNYVYNSFEKILHVRKRLPALLASVHLDLRTEVLEAVEQQLAQQKAEILNHLDQQLAQQKTDILAAIKG
jgi:hypothetical protein